MARDLPTGYATAASAPVFRPAILVFLDWPGGAVRVWNGYGNIVFGGNTYVGTGHLGSLSSIAETSDLSANGVTLALSGVPSEVLTNAMSNDAQGAEGIIYIAPLAADGTFAADPVQIFAGFIDVCPVEDSGETSTISVQLEKDLIDRRSDARRYTHEDQQLDAPGDLFFEYVAGLADKVFAWGGKTVAGSAATPGGVSPGATSSAPGSISNGAVSNVTQLER